MGMGFINQVVSTFTYHGTHCGVIRHATGLEYILKSSLNLPHTRVLQRRPLTEREAIEKSSVCCILLNKTKNMTHIYG